MSTHIVDRIEAIRFPKEAIGHYEDIFLVMDLGGDNNVTRHAQAGVHGLGHDLHRPGVASHRRLLPLRGRLLRRNDQAARPADQAGSLHPRLPQGPGKRRRWIARGRQPEHPRHRAEFALPASDKNAAYHLAEAVKAGKTPREVTRFGETRAWWTSTLPTRPTWHFGSSASTGLAGRMPEVLRPDEIDIGIPSTLLRLPGGP